MPLDRLDNLVSIGKLKAEPSAQAELDGLCRSGSERLVDARRKALSLSSRFDLVYNAGHALALAALRFHGYRSESRYIVFQVLTDTVGLATAQWRVLDDAHNKRNRSEYEGDIDLDDEYVEAVIRVVGDVEKLVVALTRSS
jgi:hypothetical protein